jgi:hypothetical protein
MNSEDAKGAKAKCLNPKCNKLEKSRGLCPKCYQTARHLVRFKKTSWQARAAAGKCKHRNETMEWLLSPAS